ncbi:hypothetical protein Taro_007266, partial [Colocasia esculenta]|nr:hypothetical protein [Colocasia esculenta]
QLFESSNGVQEDFLKWFQRYIEELKAVNDSRCTDDIEAWGRGHGRRGPSRGLTDRRLESGQRWNVKVIGGTGIGESGAQFVSHMGIVSKCKELPDGTEQWVDDESRSRYERMIQLSTTSLDSESGSTPISAEAAFISVMGKDRSGHIRCGGSWKTHHTWYGTGEGPSSTDYQHQISNIENTLKIEVEELCTEVRRRDSEMDEMRRKLEQLHKRESEMDDIRRQMLQMSTFITQFQTSQRFAASAPPRAPEDDHVDTDAEGDDFDDDDD